MLTISDLDLEWVSRANLSLDGLEAGSASVTAMTTAELSRYEDDPLMQARETHYGKYQGHPDGRCCMGCEADDPAAHVTFPCAVINEGRCEFGWDEYRCIQTEHDGGRHLMEGSYGQRMVIWPTEEEACIEIEGDE